jgi:hypothetical protein
VTASVDVRWTEVADDRGIAAVTLGEWRQEVWFRSSLPLFGERSDALVPLGVLAAMRTRRPLRVTGPVSRRLLENAGVAQDVLESFSAGELRHVDVVADGVDVALPPAAGVGVFFSGGVDSFYTYLQRADEITHLVFVRGLDVLSSGSPRDHAATDAVRRAAAELGRELVEIETNLRSVTEPFAQWTLAFGTALGGLALLLQSRLGRVYVAGGNTYETLGPWGSHPVLDPRWGNERIEIVHHGCEATRGQKVVRLASSPSALTYLRVCTRQSATFNCGECEKCTRTMVALRNAGAQGRCPTLPPVLDLGRVARQHLAPGPITTFARESLVDARRRHDWALALALRASLRPHPLGAVRARLGRARRALRRRLRGPGTEPAAVH